ncbi:MAG: DNA mismatch repair protein MutS [Saprospiraceae bacterium]|nr:DNA mismatch repair protein MutS [Bacteroidia bacterium]NNL93246.1 DNA mismatch repair protein MutS [Saprospiraceae bacterium]
MKQYFEIKQKHPDAILLFRVGDFYETFGEDAVKASQILGIVLTARNNGGSDIELAGFPYHSVNLYLPKLVKAGYRVAICEQMEKPSKEKKIVRRDVTEVVTPGVTTNENLLESDQNNFLASIFKENNRYGVAFLDISTGEFIVHEGTKQSLGKLLQSFSPHEAIFSKSQKNEFSDILGKEVYTHALDEWYFEYDYNRELILKHFNVLSLKGFGLEGHRLSQIAAGTILHYLTTIHQKNISHIHKVVRVESDRYMWLDRFTIRNLELVRSNHPSGISLLDILDKTKTPMGARMLNKWVVLPLKEIEEINKRLNRVESLVKEENVREDVFEILKTIGDLERVTSKIPLKKINPKELISIRTTLLKLRDIKGIFEKKNLASFIEITDKINPCDALDKVIFDTLNEDAPFSLSKGDVIKSGWNEALDQWKTISSNSKEILLQLQHKQIEATGIKTLKVGFNNVFGYYFEVTNKFKNEDLIPDDWVRKQTLKGAERYINSELKEIETKILQAHEKIVELEEQLYNELVSVAETYVTTLLTNASLLAEIDCYASLADLAIKNNYCKPVVDDSYVLDIKQGRHPVIETQLSVNDPYVPNDVYLDLDTQQIIMITGPNMSGKSAVLRQSALITLLAHIGSFVPAESATIGIVDKIFTRVGASDNISSGESTFMVEMNETASILNNLSQRSLIILDEIGRGTSTFDGISIAWAIAEYLHDQGDYSPKTLFATHYHELNELEESFERIKNYNVATKEIQDKVIFLRKLVKGASQASFGIHVAQLAGMPNSIVLRASQLLIELESKSVNKKKEVKETLSSNQARANLQMNLFDEGSMKFKQISEVLENIDIQSMTPIECMLKLNEIKDKLKD